MPARGDREAKSEMLGGACCPFDEILPRTPYFVLPKMAIQAMPINWRRRFAALLDEAEACGLSTPSYFVFRGGDDEYTQARLVNWRTRFVRVVKGRPDPWANYRHATHERVVEICPTFQPPA